MLVNGDFAGVELRNSICVDVGADNVVAGLSEASTRDQAYVTATYDTKIQGTSPGAAMDFGNRADRLGSLYCDGNRAKAKVAVAFRVTYWALSSRPQAEASAMSGVEFLPRNRPRKPNNARRGWRRSTFQSRRADSSRLISLSVSVSRG